MGKSTLLTQLTGTDSEAAAYEFTTLTCIPGVIHYNDAKIQLLDLPGIIEGAAQGKGRGRQVLLQWIDILVVYSHLTILRINLVWGCGSIRERSPWSIPCAY